MQGVEEELPCVAVGADGVALARPASCLSLAVTAAITLCAAVVLAMFLLIGITFQWAQQAALAPGR